MIHLNPVKRGLQLIHVCLSRHRYSENKPDLIRCAKKKTEQNRQNLPAHFGINGFDRRGGSDRPTESPQSGNPKSARALCMGRESEAGKVHCSMFKMRDGGDKTHQGNCFV